MTQTITIHFSDRAVRTGDKEDGLIRLACGRDFGESIPVTPDKRTVTCIDCLKRMHAKGIIDKEHLDMITEQKHNSHGAIQLPDIDGVFELDPEEFEGEV